jgi:Family of unknown function (DUF6498)
MKELLPNRYNLFAWLQALLMLTGLTLWHWDPLFVVMAYFFETIIIGVIHMFKMGVVLRLGRAQNREEKTNPSQSLHHPGVILFFMVHYYMFVAGQSIFIFSFFANKVPAFESAFSLIQNYGWLFRQPDFVLLFAIQAVTQITYAIRHWVMPAKYHEQTIQGMFIQPYVRIFIQQFATILAGFFVIIMQSGFAAAVLVILFRLVVDSMLLSARHHEGAKQKLIALMLQNREASPEEVKKQLESMLDQ